MKQLVAGIIILVVIGIGAFLYRNTFTHPVVPAPTSPVACTQDAKLCPDGSAVGRTGPSCAFSPCPFPNVENQDLGIAFAVPVGYHQNTVATGTGEMAQEVFTKPAKNVGEYHSITIRAYPTVPGKSATSTIIANTTYGASGAPTKSLKEFSVKIIQGHVWYCATLERFEGQVHTACYLPRTNDVLRFEILEKDVDWTNPKLDIEALPEHQAFYQMLTTLEMS